MPKIGKYFDDSEFACKCGCGRKDIDIFLVDRLDTLREQLGRPMKITSGCRCERHNASVGGKSNSAHLRGLAVDIEAASGRERYEILSRIFRLMMFSRVGIAKTFIHVDIDMSLPKQRLWLYD